MAYHLNQAGSATGGADTSNIGSFGFPVSVAFASGPAGLSRMPPPDGFDGSLGRDINDQGVVAGAAGRANGSAPLVWRSGAPAVIPLPDGYSGQAEALNNTGLVVGVPYPDQTSSFRAVVYDGSRTTLLGDGWAWGVNNAGVVVGWSGASASIYADGAWTPIPGMNGVALGINEHGDIVGYDLSQGRQRATVLASGTLTDIPLLPGTTWSLAHDINDAGVAVGFAGADHPLGGADLSTTHAFVFDPATGAEDLNDLIAPGSGWTLLRQARGINNNGQISGLGFFDGHERAFVLTPVPEPATWAMLLAGCALVWTVRLARHR